MHVKRKAFCCFRDTICHLHCLDCCGLIDQMQRLLHINLGLTWIAIRINGSSRSAVVTTLQDTRLCGQVTKLVVCAKVFWANFLLKNVQTIKNEVARAGFEPVSEVEYLFTASCQDTEVFISPNPNPKDTRFGQYFLCSPQVECLVHSLG